MHLLLFQDMALDGNDLFHDVTPLCLIFHGSGCGDTSAIIVAQNGPECKRQVVYIFARRSLLGYNAAANRSTKTRLGEQL
jgi:hypothetical protein